MLEILLVGIMFLMMARNRNYGKKSYHRNYRLRRIRIATQSAAGALATLDVVTNAVTTAASETYRLISVICSYSWSDIGAIIDDGCEFGFAHSDYTAAQVEECLESFLSIDRGDKRAQEFSNRLVRSVGTISQAGALAAAAGASFNDGKPVKTRLNWLMTTGDTLNLWIRNASGVVWTTGSSVTISGDMWIKDN